MPTINVGNTEVSDVRVGNTEVQEVYSGSTKVWERAQHVVTVGTHSYTNAYTNDLHQYFGVQRTGLYNNEVAPHNTAFGSITPDQFPQATFLPTNYPNAARDIYRVYYRKHWDHSQTTYYNYLHFVLKNGYFENTGFTSLKISGTTYPRTSATFFNHQNGLSIASWQWYLGSGSTYSNNPFGETVGAEVGIQVIV